MSSNEVPDLANVLKTLSAFNSSTGAPNHGNANALSAVSSGPATSTAARYDSQPQTVASENPPPKHHIASQAPARGSATADPSTITAWPAALRSVMNTVSQNEAACAKIRHLISTQHDHERTWWKGRENLLDKQKSRAERKMKLDEVLRSVGGSVAKNMDTPTPDEDKRELQTYDEKVHRALTQMSKALDTELQALGIPFFAIKYELVLPQNTTTGSEGGDDAKGYLTTGELQALKGRMLDLLQDLCKE